MVINDFTASWDLVADVEYIFQYHFMQNAYLAGTMVAIVAGIMGYFMILRSQTFAGHSLAQVGFAGATGASLVGIPPVTGLFIAGVLAALGIQYLGSTARQIQKYDIAIGAMQTFCLALGFLFITLSSKEYAASIYNVLFGVPLGISDSDVQIIFITSFIISIILWCIARPLFFASVDPTVATSQGVPVQVLGLTFFILLAVTVSIAVQVAGVLLIFALLVTPSAIAQQITSRPASAILLACVLAVAFTWLGLAVAFYSDYPVGFFIPTFAFGGYLLVRGARWTRQVYMSKQFKFSEAAE